MARRRGSEFESEYSWGSGLTPKDLEVAPPSQGGRYRGKSPATVDDPALRALADALDRRAGT